MGYGGEPALIPATSKVEDEMRSDGELILLRTEEKQTHVRASDG
jgi:hypothetical protein